MGTLTPITKLETSMTKTLTYKVVLLPLLAIVFGAFVYATVAHANPSYLPKFLTTGNGSAATTTLTYMAAGVGTTTLIYDSYTPSGFSPKTDSALVTFIVDATSTITQPRVNARVEYALDTGANCSLSPTTCDWFPITSATNANASTTSMTGDFSDMQWTISTSTTDQGGSSQYIAAATSTKYLSFNLPTPTRYARIKFYVPATGGNMSIWAAVQPAKQQ